MLTSSSSSLTFLCCSGSEEGEFVSHLSSSGSCKMRWLWWPPALRKFRQAAISLWCMVIICIFYGTYVEWILLNAILFGKQEMYTQKTGSFLCRAAAISSMSAADGHEWRRWWWLFILNIIIIIIVSDLHHWDAFNFVCVRLMPYQLILTHLCSPPLSISSADCCFGYGRSWNCINK